MNTVLNVTTYPPLNQCGFVKYACVTLVAAKGTGFARPSPGLKYGYRSEK